MTSLTNIWHEFAFRSCHMTSMNTVFCFTVHGSCHGWNAPDCTWSYSNFCSVLSVDNFWPSLMVLVPHAAPWTLFTNNPDHNKPALPQTSQQEPKQWYHWSYSLQKSLCIPQKWGSQFCSGLYTMLILASVFIVFPKHLADFLQVKGILYYSYMQITHFSM